MCRPIPDVGRNLRHPAGRNTIRGPNNDLEKIVSKRVSDSFGCLASGDDFGALYS
jgi:hypothetical protein